MTLLLALTVGCLYAAALFMMLRRSIVKLIFGLALLSHGTNLLIFTAGGLTRGHPPLIPEGATTLQQPYADPIAQALILTAIVISFAVLAFAVVLLYRVYQTIGTDNMDMLRAPDA
jgi:multicomponent Na+:H+ antiporter subunit C